MPLPAVRVIYNLLCDGFEALESAGLLHSEPSEIVSFEAAQLIDNHSILTLAKRLQVKQNLKLQSNNVRDGVEDGSRNYHYSPTPL